MTILLVLIGIALIATLGILMTGVIGMARGGDFNKKYGNKLMQMRVAAQFTAIALILLFVFVASRQ